MKTDKKNIGHHFYFKEIVSYVGVRENSKNKKIPEFVYRFV